MSKSKKTKVETSNSVVNNNTMTKSPITTSKKDEVKSIETIKIQKQFEEMNKLQEQAISQQQSQIKKIANELINTYKLSLQKIVDESKEFSDSLELDNQVINNMASLKINNIDLQKENELLKEYRNNILQDSFKTLEKNTNKIISDLNNILESSSSERFQKLNDSYNKNIKEIRSIYEESLDEYKKAINPIIENYNESLENKLQELKYSNELKLKIQFDKQEKELETFKLKLEDQEAKLENQADDLEHDKRTYKDEINRENRIVLDNLKLELENEKYINSRYEEENRELNEKNKNLVGEDSDYKKIVSKFGSAQVVIKNDKDKTNKIKLLENENKELEKELKEITQFKNEYEDIIREKNIIKEQLEHQNKLNYELGMEKESLIASLTRCKQELERFNPSTSLSEEDRAIVINQNTCDFLDNKRINDTHISEIEWLDSIRSKIKDYGFSFSKRLIYAFHTALKTSDINTLAILAGVSGTGKSELPRLYSNFGGLNFINVPVQPDWDSHENLLGFYNSIDNRLEATELVKFLITINEIGDDTVNIVMLDEMNLAHIERYFAVFLSKLEERRGNELPPELPIKMTVSAEDYKLRLTRNVLWVGTLNQDHTTKTLSDKVIDRGLVINFPKPSKLISRTKSKALPNNTELLSNNVWSSWIQAEDVDNETYKKTINKYNEIIENINKYMSFAKIAIGHRVWQAIEKYVLNYPTVLQQIRENNSEGIKSEMKKAFEDQLAQKIMPKLNGVETSGKPRTNCLNKIESILKDGGFTSLLPDFKNALENDYVFSWNSSKYLEDKEIIKKDSPEKLKKETKKLTKEEVKKDVKEESSTSKKTKFSNINTKSAPKQEWVKDSRISSSLKK